MKLFMVYGTQPQVVAAFYQALVPVLATIIQLKRCKMRLIKIVQLNIQVMVFVIRVRSVYLNVVQIMVFI
jgi:hypothetical protein